MKRAHYWEVKVFLINQETLRTLWNPDINYCLHKSLPCLYPNPDVYDPHHAVTFSFFKIHLNIILSSTNGY